MTRRQKNRGKRIDEQRERARPLPFFVQSAVPGEHHPRLQVLDLHDIRAQDGRRQLVPGIPARLLQLLRHVRQGGHPPAAGLKVPKLGPKAYEQCAGFLRVPESRTAPSRTLTFTMSPTATASEGCFKNFPLLIWEICTSLSTISSVIVDFRLQFLRFFFNFFEVAMTSSLAFSDACCAASLFSSRAGAAQVPRSPRPSGSPWRRTRFC